ncbi:MAG: DUF2795 domain-containing protein [Acidobacteriota bacterium]
MPITILEQGHYELFLTNNNNKILVLDDKNWFAWDASDAGGQIIFSDNNHRRARTLQSGQYYLVDINRENRFKDSRYLFIENDNQFQILLLPDGLPTETNTQTSIIKPNETISTDNLIKLLGLTKQHLTTKRIVVPGVGSATSVANYLKGVDFPTNLKEIIDYVHRLRGPVDLIDQLKKLAKRTYTSIDDIIKEIETIYSGARKAQQLPIQDYDRMTTDEIKANLTNQQPQDIELLRDYESIHKGRIDLLEEFDRRLAQVKHVGVK